MVERTGQQCTVYQSGAIRVAVSTPENETCRAGRYLRRHPAGIGSMTFEVEDIERTWNFLLNRQATPITESSMHGRTEVATGTSVSRHPLETLRSVSFRKRTLKDSLRDSNPLQFRRERR